jgi:hypothetical protein
MALAHDPRSADQGVIEDAMIFVALGLEPGGCTMSMILNDLKAATNRCHPIAKPYIHNTFKAVRHVIRPLNLKSPEDVQEWMKQGGLLGSDPVFAIQMKLTCPTTYESIMRLVKKFRKEEDEDTE